jgi:hypothetical protein
LIGVPAADNALNALIIPVTVPNKMQEYLKIPL